MKSSREVKEAATLAERQRIIKLLEECKKDNKPMLTWQYALEIAIATIKGENK